MKRRRSWLITVTVLAVAGPVAAMAMNPRRGPEPGDESDLARTVLSSHPGVAAVVDQAVRFRLQVMLGLVEDDGDRPILRQHGFRAEAEYFYPASAVKLFAAVAALERLSELRRATGLAIDADTALVFHPLFADEQLQERDPDNLDDGRITVRQEIRKLFLISDNEAFNRLYELVGQDRLAESLDRAGLGAARIVHRLSEPRTLEENRRAPRIDLYGNTFRYSIRERLAAPPAKPEPVDGILVGHGYLGPQGQIDEPVDFTHKNRIGLAELQRGLCMVVRPDVDCGGQGFDLDDADRALLLEAMVRYPRESTNPLYDSAEYPDDYVKFLLPGLERAVSKERLRIFNKVGQAYGFTTENAWVVDDATGRGFFLAATLYTNDNGILNDDQYDYDEIALPFLADLGEAAARVLWDHSD